MERHRLDRDGVPRTEPERRLMAMARRNALILAAANLAAGAALMLGAAGSAPSLLFLAITAHTGRNSALTAAQLPSHTHTLSINSVGDHSHGISADGGNHGGHFPVGSHLAAAGADLGLAAHDDGVGNSAHDDGVGNSAHDHGGGTGSTGGHSHSGTAAAAGTGSTMDNRPPYIVANVLIWT
jgi:hypothetical protein